MKKGIKELTEGMQRLCAIANRIVAQGDEVSPIERDLLLEDLRFLYDVALGLGGEEKGVRGEKRESKRLSMPDEEILSSTVMATMAAMAPAPVAEAQDAPTVAEKPAPVVVEMPAPAVETQQAASLHTLYADIAAPNTASINLFRKAGYEECGRFKEWLELDSHFIDNIRMQKIL